MPTLTYQTSTGLYGGLLNGRLLIGRKLSYGLSFADNTVSRLHAWIDPDPAGWILVDTGSRTGTFVNDQPIARQLLNDGDVIRVGTNHLHFSAADELAAGVQEQTWTAPSGVVRKDGILFQCACGAPLWVGVDLAGKRGICRHCRQPVTAPTLTAPAEAPTDPIPAPAESRAALPPGSVPRETVPKSEIKNPAVAPLGSPAAQKSESPDTAMPVRKTADKPKKCSICHSPINPGESFVTCPDCAMQYHAECWQENLGCSSYGCPQVNCLKPAEATPAPVPVEKSDAPSTEAEIAPPGLPWELLLLAASIGSLLGALLFGGLSAIVVLGCIVLMIKHRPLRWGLLLLALTIGTLGVTVGLVLSDFWWFSSAHTPNVISKHLHF
jgi:hypothetical protein